MHPLVAECLQGDRYALARLITLVENNDPQKNDILTELYPHTGKAFVIGITGAPGAGKSSLVARLLREIRREGLTVGVIAVDPSSAFTSGAVLGDRTRMTEHTLDQGVFIRSMGTRGSLGGLSRATCDVIQVLDAAGKDLVLVETVGVGQSEVEIAKAADTAVVVLTPAGGDSVQTIKAGIMEIADVFVINKADLPGAERISTEVEVMLEIRGETLWQPPVISTVSLRHEGIGELWAALKGHRRFLEEGSRLMEVRRERVSRQLTDQVEDLVRTQLWEKVRERLSLDGLVEEIILRRQDPYSAARELFRQIKLVFAGT